MYGQITRALVEELLSSANEQMSKLSWNQKVHYLVYKNPLFVPLLSQINSVHNL